MPAARKKAAPVRKKVAAKKTRKPAASSRPVLRDVKAKGAPPSDVAEAAFPHLRPTNDPNVFLNEDGAAVDKDGVLLNLRGAFNGREVENKHATELIGSAIDSPAQLLKYVALNPLMPMGMRVDAAKAAAPFFDRKTPVAVETKNEDFTVDVARVLALPREKRKALLDTLKELGVDLGVKA